VESTIEKLTDERLDTLICVYDKGVYEGSIAPMNMYEALALLLEIKQFRAERRRGCVKKETPQPRNLSRDFVN
jgi:hypothetical protein